MRLILCFSFLLLALVQFPACKGGQGKTKYSCKPMHQDDYGQVFNRISGRRMEMDKLEEAKQSTAAAKCMTAQQISQIMALLRMEQDKLEYAKFAFTFCADQKNYGIMNNHLMMEMSKTELGKLTGVN